MTKWFNPECETRILIKLLLSMTHIFIVFLMWVSPLVHDAIKLFQWVENIIHIIILIISRKQNYKAYTCRWEKVKYIYNNNSFVIVYHRVKFDDSVNLIFTIKYFDLKIFSGKVTTSVMFRETFSSLFREITSFKEIFP